MRFVKRFLIRLGFKFKWLLDELSMYTNINDLPTSKWWEINATQNYSLLLKNKIGITQGIYDKCEAVWEQVEQQHIDRFGHSKEFLDYWRELSHLYSKKIKAAVNGGSDESHYEYAQIRFDAMYKGKKSNNLKLKGMVERVLNLGYRIDPNVMPIAEFSSLVELTNETVKDGGN